VTLHKNSIQVWQGDDFLGYSPDAAWERSKSEWSRYFMRVESELNIVLFKGDALKAHMIHRGEYAEIDNEFARDAHIRGEKIKFYGPDGEAWLEVDRSKDRVELDFTHPTLARQDSEELKRVFDDLREREHWLPSETREAVNLLFQRELKLQEQVYEIGAGLNALLMMLNPQSREAPSEAAPRADKPDYVG